MEDWTQDALVKSGWNEENGWFSWESEE